MKKISVGPFGSQTRSIEISEELDTTVNFKVNSVLKEEFEVLCKSNYSNMSRELKIYMEKCVTAQKFDIFKEYY